MAGALKREAHSQALLDPARGPLLAALREATPHGPDFAARGCALALAQGACIPGPRGANFFPRLRENIAVLHVAHRAILRRRRRGQDVSAAGVWLLDNVHVLTAQTRAVHDGLPRRYYRGLPVLAGTAQAGMPRIYGIAWAYVEHADSAFDAASVVDFLRAYQQVHGLTLGELWALPTTFRVVLIENLRRLAERVASQEAAREAADRLCDAGGPLDVRHPRDARFLSADSQSPARLFERMRARGVSTAFALQVMQRLHADSDVGTLRGSQAREAVRAALAEALPDPDAAAARLQAGLAADDLSVAQAIRALQALASADWRGIIGQASATIACLSAAPAFAGERDDTQDITLHAVERLARRSRHTEPEVAAVLVSLMSEPPPLDALGVGAPADAAGYWIDGPGAPTLHAALGLRPSPWRALGGLLRRHALALYLATLVFGTGAFLLAFLTGSAAPGLSWPMWVACGLLALWPASEVVGAAMQRLITEWAPTRRPPRLALAGGIPPEHRVLVVVPAMLTDADGVLRLAQRLEQHHLANREANAQFALLSDHADADRAVLPGDAALLAAAVAAVDALEARHAQHSSADQGVLEARRFLLLHRERSWSETEQQWIGWERKRGKLEQLVALLADDAHGVGAAGVPRAPATSPFVDLGPRSHPAPGTAHVLTLDSDTVLPPGTLRDLVGVAAHPLNRPRLDMARRRVAAGHAILQPRIDVAWPAPGEATVYHRLFAGQYGNDPYNAASSDVYSDLFDEASFSGKGLLHVAALHAVLGGRLPNGQVLSHDLLEGAIARCGGVGDVHLSEPAPNHADVAAARVHRWTRGDWQLTPLLLQPRRYGLRTIDVWKMLDNLRRSLVAPASLALLAWALVAGLVAPWAAFVLGLAAFGTGPLLGALAGLAPRRDDLALLHFARGALADLGRAALGTLWQVALWPRQALANAGAIGLALWRTAVSRRLLLQWTTADALHAAAQHSLGTLGRRHGALVIGTTLGVGAVLSLGTTAPLLALALGLLWAGTPLWIFLASRKTPPRREPLAAVDREYLHRLARETWSFFEQHVDATSHHLPPDNVQTVPHTVVAQRTSPTNVGLYLLSVTAAREFGWIDTPQMLARCEATLDTLESLPRFRGHFMNWIDTHTLKTLPPAYVSSVDSGNLCVSLLALAGACDELAGGAAADDNNTVSGDSPVAQVGAAAADTASALRLSGLAGRCRTLAEATEFGFLFDPRRRLLHIGWRVDDALPDSGLYDLLASESRLASLWAIAKGDVPATHWAALGRPFQAEGPHVGLRSWSGSMFEYLMPALVLDEPEGSALGLATRMAVHEQRRFGRAHGLPWGVSECAHAAVDRSLAYQYGPQGVPRLALRRTPPDELVIAPYATLMAAMVEPQAAVANLRRLEALGARGPWGFIEALDYTPQRQTEPPHATPVSTTMAHHQGMALVALAQVLLAGAPRRWTMAEPQLRAVAPLLHERAPREVAAVAPPVLEVTAHDEPAALARGSGVIDPGASALQPTQLLGNGRYGVAMRPNGAGFSRWLGVDISRWRDDALRDAMGHFIFVRRGPEAAPRSITQHPAPDPEAHYEARFEAECAIFDATWPDLRVRCTVRVSPDDDVELRHVELWNTSTRRITLELLSMFEVSLSPARADEMHPAFANLFVQAEWSAAEQTLAFTRRPRRDDEAALHAVHFVADADECVRPARAVADRGAWLGRLRGPWQPRARFVQADSVAGPRATGLDPVAALALRLRLEAHGTAQLTLGTAAGPQRADLQALVQRLRQAGGAAARTQASPAAAVLALLRQGERRLSAEDRWAAQTLATALVLLQSRPAGASAAAVGDRRAFWRLGLSGERPVISVQIRELAGVPMVRSLVGALVWWARGGVACDLVVVNAEPHSYVMALQRELLALREGHAVALRADAVPAPDEIASLHLWQAGELTASERANLALLARVRLHADGRPLAEHVAELVAWHDTALAGRDEQHGIALATAAAVEQGEMVEMTDGAQRAERADRADSPDADSDESSGSSERWEVTGAVDRTDERVPAAQTLRPGRFNADDGSFAFQQSGQQGSPRPWVNVLANPALGALVTQSGAGCTWAGNSRLHQLTPWCNDVLQEMDGESFFVQDLRTRELWRIGRWIGEPETVNTIVHGIGSSTIRHRHRGLEVRATWCVDAETAVKRVRIEIANRSGRTQRLRIAGLLEWVLGSVRSDRQFVRTAFATAATAATATGGDAQTHVHLLLATQCDNHEGRGGHTAFFALHRAGSTGAALEDWTCDRRELFDSRGRRVLPDLLGRRAGAGLDPCAAASLPMRLAEGETQACTFVIGHAHSPEAARALAGRSVVVDAVQAEHTARAGFTTLLGAVRVKSPDPLFDAMVNHWLLYQVTACRLWARAGFFQASGAYGFRDQLQDAMALAVSAPQLLREHLLRAAARQFAEGDVQHWWHPPSGAGVRTHFSDDRLWLPQATLHYVRVSADAAVLDEVVPFIAGVAVPAGAEDAYFVPEPVLPGATLYEHCARAIDRSLAVGAHGLPLMGGGDWNDGMNRVGHGGRGESVWLGWFLCAIVAGFAPLARSRGEPERAERWQQAAAGWREALQGAAWDGEWFVRAFFDEGSALGGHANAECRIDLVAQAWSVLSGVATTEQQTTAMAAAARWLADPALGVWKLLTPPLQAAVPSAGYIQAYPPGVRENGGQYAHAAVWALMAQAQLGDADGAWRTWTWLSPAHRAIHPQWGTAYGLEPYAMAADIYTEPPYVGRGGWSWYTGSAALMHRAAVESICGLEVQGQRVRVCPRLPGHWPAVTLTLRRAGRAFRFTVCAAWADEEIARAFAQGAVALAEGAWLALEAQGTAAHHVVVGPSVAVTRQPDPAAACRTPA